MKAAAVKAVPRMAPPRRVALVAPGGEAIGGQAIQARLLAGHLREAGYEVTLLPTDPSFPRGLGQLRRVPVARTLVNQALYLPSLMTLRSFDVVHIFSASWWSFFLAPVPAIIAARNLGKRIVLNYHSGEAEEHLTRWKRSVAPWLRLVDEIVVPSEYLRSVFLAHGYQARVIPNIIDTSFFRFHERQPLLPRLLSTRNLEPHYRVDVTLRAFAMLRQTHPDATLTIAGSGSEERSLRQLAADLGSRVRFAGGVTPDVMARLYHDSDIFVNASVVDNQPLSVLEAFAAGTPVVSTATGGIATMVRDDQTGVTIPPDDPAAMATAVRGLLADPERAAGLARRARREAESHTWSRVRESWATVYAGGPS